MVGGLCHLKSAHSLGYERGLERFGWRVDEMSSRPGGMMVGWVDLKKGCVHLLPSAAYRFAIETTSRMGNAIPLSERGLWKQLGAHSMLISGDSRACTSQLRFPEGRIRVLTLAPSVVPVEVEATNEESADVIADAL